MQDAWSQCAGIWKKSELYKKIVERKKTTAHGARLWLTRGQLVEKYRDEHMANVICDGKLADEELKKTHTKRHPDCPQDASEAQVEARYQIDVMYWTKVACMSGVLCFKTILKLVVRLKKKY